MYSLVVVRGSSIGTKNFASLYVGVPMANKIGLKDGRSSVTILWTLAEPNIIPGLESERLKSLCCSMEISFFSLRFLRTSFKLFYRDVDSFKVSNLDKEFIKSRLRNSAFSSYKDTGKTLEKNLPKEEFVALKILI